ncbi:MAG: hypothetical protein HUK02_00670 [Bacteroidaceae bacterium]|nr:hypothetical protein [Bacteroidaceae bacterium]
MAKAKDPAELTVEEKLKNLYALQTLNSEIDKIKTLRGELPLEVQDLEDSIAGLETRIDKIQTEIADLEREISDRRGAIESAKTSIQRFEEQLNGVRNNREYDSLCKEIEYLKLDTEAHLKKIHEAEEALKVQREEQVRCATDVKDRRTDLDIKKSELDEIVAETKAEEDKLRERAKNVELTIEPRLLAAFKRIRKNSRNGLGVVYVQRDACGGCFNKIPPQRQLDIRMRKKIIVCEYCGRIMVDPELAGVQVNTPVEEKPKRTRRTGTRKAAAAKAEAAKPESAE